ncbi:hypothetical protein KY290_023035 [Solanum tuberosum]|uniref:Uncharacterized protein n=1 Tax=Solanum tuberosum TaxID=4113 RepID=A0ABQ7V659_SOLTU|nr:hypothetical protein KY284_022606 [Solanum tuberosum]KAH0684317.1 hypothetical protein KY289_022069 [Solanum tuberosum]KAH0694713.1 hypothetical protein KY285_021810 [Solanum tuberosum]KAH0759542.1 hypothetical protein KY290_023035 [Solanum tuberosum]
MGVRVKMRYAEDVKDIINKFKIKLIVSVPMWLIILSDQVLIIAFVSYCLTN